MVQQEGCSGSGASPDVSAPSAEENVVAEENVIPAGTYLDLIDPEGDLTEAEKGDYTRKQPDKVKRKKLSKQSDTLPAKKLRVDHPSLAFGTGGKLLASLRRTISEGSLALGPSSQAVVYAKVTVQGSHVTDAPVYTVAAAVTSSRGKMHAASMSDIGGSSQLETSEGSADSFYETAALNSEDAKRWYIPRWNITNDSLLDNGFSCRTLVDRVAPPPERGRAGAGPDVSAPSAEENVVAEENVIPAGTYLDLMDPEGDLTEAEKGDAARKQPDKVKRKKLSKQSDTLPAKKLRVDHPSLASGTGGKSLASLRRTIPEGSLALGPSSQAVVHAKVTVQGSHVADAPVYTAAAAVTSSRGKMHAASMSDMGGSSQLETSEGSADSFYETAALNSEDAKRWYIPRWNITNDSLLDDGFSCRTLICLGSEVRSRTEHELELKEKLRVKYDARGVLLKEKDVEIARLKSLVKEKETESAEVSRLRDQVSVLTTKKSSLSAKVSVLKSVVSQKETDISLLDSRATYLKSALDDSQAACDEARNLISSLSSERDGLASEVSTLHSAFRDFKEKMEAQQEAQAQVLYNRVAELEAHVMDVSGRLEGEFYPAYLTALAGRRWLLTHGMELAMVKCLKSPEYQGILGHALGRAVDYGMQEGLAAGHEHGVAGNPLSAVMAYNLEAAEAHYLDAVRALEEANFPLVQLLKSNKDSEIDEVLDCFLLDGPLADLPEVARLQPCLEQLYVPIYHADIKTVVGETSLSFALLNVHTRAEGARKHAAALRQLMVDIISHLLSSQNLIGEASTSTATFFVEDLDTDEDLGSVVCMP
ncbi:hypothetical protein Tco_1386599 [Tanacetum coccineum]